MKHIERIVPGTNEWTLYHGNHMVRYEFARQQLKQAQIQEYVIDAACGVGYGSYFLAESGMKHISAIDISANALEKAKKHFSHPQIQYTQLDVTKLTQVAKDQHAVISFETLEHLKEPAQFLNQCYQALRRDGLLIISTPNVLVTEHFSKEDWEFHEKEYSPNEFHQLLKDAGFQSIQLYAQEYTAIGQLRNDIRHELNVLRTNPVMRIGMWIQQTFRKHQILPPLPEKKEDFHFNLLTEDSKDNTQAFVLMAVAKKGN